MKRLASLHYNHSELPQDSSSNLKSFAKREKKGDGIPAINSCQGERDCNTNGTSKAPATDDCDEVDFQSTSDRCHIERIDATANNSSRTRKNMGSNVSTSGGKGLSGRRTQSSSEFHPFSPVTPSSMHENSLWSRLISWIARFEMNIWCGWDIVKAFRGFIFQDNGSE